MQTIQPVAAPERVAHLLNVAAATPHYANLIAALELHAQKVAETDASNAQDYSAIVRGLRQFIEGLEP
jgi:hypothetical protein